MLRNVDRKTIWDPSALVQSRGPRIVELKRRGAEIVLARNHVGRCAFIAEGRVEVLPVHYIYSDGLVVGRTALGLKHRTWLSRDRVVFEVDEVDGLFDWRSVIVRGWVALMHSRESAEERLAFEVAVAAFRSLIPDAFTERDPTPERTILFAIAPETITAKQAMMR